VKRPHSTGLVWTLCLASMLAGGCEAVQDALKTDKDRWFAADLVWRKPDRPRMDMIGKTISAADTVDEAIPNAVPPTDEETKYRDEDYVVGTTDVLDITIMDLFSVGAETLLRREVSDAGYIDLPLLPQRI